MTESVLTRRPAGGFHHEALFYRGEEQFVAASAAFLRAAAAAGEPSLVATSPEKIEMVRGDLGANAGEVEFVDMREIGRNPARIIPMWQAYVAEHPGRPLRGIGEPVWPGRTDDELAECIGHEELLNAAFQATPLWLLCPYDTAHLEPDAVAAAQRTHPHVIADEERGPSADYRGDESRALTDPLPEPPRVLDELAFEGSLASVRLLVAKHAAATGLGGERTDSLVLAVSEVAANSLRHGGGRGSLRTWHSGRALVCEIRDDGRITEPLTGRRRPHPDAVGGRGLWIANHLCDLVQVRSTATGTVVRLHMTTATATAKSA